MDVRCGLKFSPEVEREWFDMVKQCVDLHPSDDPQRRKVMRSLNYLGKMLLTKLKEQK